MFWDMVPRIFGDACVRKRLPEHHERVDAVIWTREKSGESCMCQQLLLSDMDGKEHSSKLDCVFYTDRAYNDCEGRIQIE